jgi:hypothetical protein
MIQSFRDRFGQPHQFGRCPCGQDHDERQTRLVSAHSHLVDVLVLLDEAEDEIRRLADLDEHDDFGDVMDELMIAIDHSVTAERYLDYVVRGEPELDW